jgi:hypothetical protein
MARVNNALMKGTSGAIGKDTVFRTFKHKTFSGKFPDMSHIIPSKNQTKGRERFAKAVAYAKSVMKDPEKSAEYKARKSYSVYHAALKDYLEWFNPDKPIRLSLPAHVKTALSSASLSDPQLRAVAYLNEHKKLSNRNYQEMNAVSKATATRHLHDLTAKGIIQFNGGKGAGAHYLMGSLRKKK